MKKIIIIISLLTFKSTFGQTKIPQYTFSKNKDLSNEAFQVFKTNKFLDFKDRDSLVEIVDKVVYDKIELNNYFDYKKNWNEIEDETYLTYNQDDKMYNYTFKNNTMTESYVKYGSYNVWREIKTLYNSKGFILNENEKIFVGDDYNETRIIINQFDNKNRVVKIINRTEARDPNENNEYIILVSYGENTVTVSSPKGTILCNFITDKNSIGYISKLSPRATSNNFMHAIGQRRFELAKEYCTDKLLKKNQSLSDTYNQLENVKWLDGRDFLSRGRVEIEDVWEMKFSQKETKNYIVKFIILKQNNGWKIDEFIISK